MPETIVPEMLPRETFVSVDIETAGPTPSQYSMLSIGACIVDAPDRGFYVELQPTTDAVVDSSLAVGGLSMQKLLEHGTPPAAAMLQFEQWLQREVPAGSVPVFVGFNAAFDWMFVADYFQRYLGRNPFGHSALDIKSYSMGMAASSWAATSMKFLSPLYLDGSKLSHNALEDARNQAQLFRALRTETGTGD